MFFLPYPKASLERHYRKEQVPISLALALTHARVRHTA
jgi:hypothetical protein